MPIRIMSEGLTLYRGERGAAHLLAFRCAHRGTQLSTGWVEGDELRCFYHGWKYDGSGRCIEQPAEPEPFCQKIRIRSYPVQEYLGLVFAYLGDEDPPPLPRYPDFEEDRAADVWVEARACNFFNNLENLCDTVHVSFVHRQSRAGLSNAPIPLVSGGESQWGVSMRYTMPGGGVSVSHLGMPNIKYVQVPSAPDPAVGPSDKLMWLVPIDDENHLTFSFELAPLRGESGRSYLEQRARWRASHTTSAFETAKAVLSGHRAVHDLDEATDRVDIVRLQDDVAQIGQGRIADRRQERLGHSDANVVLLRKLWARELRALADGGALQRWIRNDELPRAKWGRQ